MLLFFRTLYSRAPRTKPHRRKFRLTEDLLWVSTSIRLGFPVLTQIPGTRGEAVGTAGASARPAKSWSLPGSTQGHSWLLWELPLPSFSLSRGEICTDQGRQRAGRGSRERMGSVITESHQNGGMEHPPPFHSPLAFSGCSHSSERPTGEPRGCTRAALSPLPLASTCCSTEPPLGAPGLHMQETRAREGWEKGHRTHYHHQNNQRPLYKPILDSQLRDAGSVSPRCVTTVGSSPSDTRMVSEMEEERGQGEHRRTGALGHKGPVSEVSWETCKRDGPMNMEPQRAASCEIWGPTGKNRMDADATLQDASGEPQPGLRRGSARMLQAELGRSSRSLRSPAQPSPAPPALTAPG